jgi:TonB family protein
MKFQQLAFAVIVFSLSSAVLGQTQRFPEVKAIFAPPYPPAARAVLAQGDVEVAVEVDENGNVVAAQARSGHPLLRAAARAAAARWTFVPVPGRHFLTLRFEFRLGDFDKKKNAKLIGTYTLRNIEPEGRIVQTVSYSAQSNNK